MHAIFFSRLHPSFFHHAVHITLMFFLIIFSSTHAIGNSLSNSYLLAQDYDAQLKAAKANLEIISASAKQSLSPLLPQVNAQYQINEQRSKSNISGSQIVAGRPVEIEDGQYSTRGKQKASQFSIQQPLFDLEKWNTYQSGKLVAKRAQAEYVNHQQQLIIRVANAYFDVLKAGTDLENDLAEEKALREQLRRTTLYYDHGLLSITEIHEAEAAADLAEARSLNSKNQLAVNKETLSALTGEKNPTVWRLSVDFSTPELIPNNKEQWVAQAMTNNWNILASRYDVESAQKNLKAKQYASMPTVNSSFTYGNNDGNEKNHTFNSEIDSDLKDKTISININLPLYSGGFISAEKRKAAAELELKQHQHTQLSRDISQTVRRLFLTTQTLQLQIQAQQKAVKSAHSSLKTIRFGYENGTRNLADVLQAQSSVYNAQRNYENTRYDYLVALLNLKYNAGVISEEDMATIDVWLTPNSSSLEDTSTITQQNSNQKIEKILPDTSAAIN